MLQAPRDLRLAVPPGWHTSRPDDGPVVLLATGPADAATGLAPTLLCSLDGRAPFDQLLRRTLATLSDPRVVAVEADESGADVLATVSHDVAGTGSTLLLRHLPDHGAVVTASAPDLAWPRLGPLLRAAVRTAGT